jgi:SAM-dependent methyltransferase
MTKLLLACPSCHTLLEDIDFLTKRCPKDGLTFHPVDGVWCMLLPDRADHYSRFIRDYETVRRSEGRGATDARYYQMLPYISSRDWQIRAKSFETFLKYVIVPLEKRANPLSILDLGAGNGWLSNRLAARGHDIAAVDLTVNEFDGLGCYRHYKTTFLPVQAEFDHLPFEEKAINIVLFNASLHYSENYAKTLGESLRVLKSGGKIVVLDSPVYRNPASGSGMVREREEQFTKRFGFPSDNLKSENYLTYARLDDLARELNLSWKLITPFYDIRWTARPLLATLLGRREPAKFHVIVGERK